MSFTRSWWLGAAPFLVVGAIWLVLHVEAALVGPAPVLDGELIGPDAYMRVVRVQELQAGGDWFDTVIERSNTPHGDELHWTRPFDIVILAGAGVLSPLLSTADAIFWSAAVLSPLLQLAAIFAIGWAVRPLLGRAGGIVAMGVLLVQPGVLLASVSGRADHHLLQILVLVVALGWLLRASIRPRDADGVRRGDTAAVMAGVASGLALWVSAESLAWITLAVAVLGFAWLREGRERLYVNLRFAGAFWATVGMALAVERPMHDWLTSEYDRISIAHLGAATALLAMWSAVWLLTARNSGLVYRWGQRIGPTRERGLLGAGAGLMGLGGLLAVFPGNMESPLAGLDPRIESVLLSRIEELAPLAPTSIDRAGDFFLYLGAALVVVPVVGVMLWRRRREDDWAAWLLIAVLGLVMIGLAIQHVRVAPFAGVFLAIGVTAAVVKARERWRGHSNELVRTFGAIWLGALLLAGGPLAAVALSTATTGATSGDDPTAPPERCDVHAAADWLASPDGLGRAEQVVLTSYFYGPELLYRTDHRVLAGPYHRNADTILDVFDALTAVDDAPARQLIAERGVDIVLLCPSNAEDNTFFASTGPDGLRQRLLGGEIPDWLRPIETPDESGFQVWEVVS